MKTKTVKLTDDQIDLICEELQNANDAEAFYLGSGDPNADAEELLDFAKSIAARKVIISMLWA